MGWRCGLSRRMLALEMGIGDQEQVAANIDLVTSAWSDNCLFQESTSVGFRLKILIISTKTILHSIFFSK